MPSTARPAGVSVAVWVLRHICGDSPKRLNQPLCHPRHADRCTKSESEPKFGAYLHDGTRTPPNPLHSTSFFPTPFPARRPRPAPIRARCHGSDDGGHSAALQAFQSGAPPRCRCRRRRRPAPLAWPIPAASSPPAAATAARSPRLSGHRRALSIAITLDGCEERLSLTLSSESAFYLRTGRTRSGDGTAASFATDSVSKFEFLCQRPVNLVGKSRGDSTKSTGRPFNYPRFWEKAVSSTVGRSSRALPISVEISESRPARG